MAFAAKSDRSRSSYSVDGAVCAVRVGDAAITLEEMEGDAGAHGGAVGTVFT
jgi:hypothetical protein